MLRAVRRGSVPRTVLIAGCARRRRRRHRRGGGRVGAGAPVGGHAGAARVGDPQGPRRRRGDARRPARRPARAGGAAAAAGARAPRAAVLGSERPRGRGAPAGGRRPRHRRDRAGAGVQRTDDQERAATRCAARSSRRLRASPAGAGGANFAERSSRPSPTLHPAPRSRGARPGAAPAPVFRTRRARRHGTASERSACACRDATRSLPVLRTCAYAGRGHGVDVGPMWSVRGDGAAPVRLVGPRTTPRLVVCRHPGSSPPTSTARCSTPTTGSPLGPPRSSTG